MHEEERDLRNAVKNAKSAFYTFKSKKRKQTRKEERRANRALKKSKKNEFLLKKYNVENNTEKLPDAQAVKRKRKRKRKKRDKIISGDLSEENNIDTDTIANKNDDKIISSLEKKLGFRSKKHLPSIFQQDGLDYILEVCNPITEDSKGWSSDEEYLNKKSKVVKPIPEKVSKELDDKELSNKLLFEERCDGENDENEYSEDEDDITNEIDGEFNVDGEESETGSDNEQDEIVEPNDSVIKKVDHTDSKHVKDESDVKMKYIPPSLRGIGNSEDDRRKIKDEKIKRKLKGLLNRVSDGTLPAIISEMEQMYASNSRNFMNEILYTMISDVCVSTIAVPEKLVIQHMIIVAALHIITASEIGSYFLQMVAERFSKLHSNSSKNTSGKTCHNLLLMLTSLYNLKVVDCLLIYDLIRICLGRYTEQDIEMIFLILKSCGPDIRKDDPGSLKEVIIEVQTKSSEIEIGNQSYVRFMIDAMNALKNNDLRKIPHYNASIVDDARKCLKLIVHGKESMGSGVQLKVSLNDLLDAENKGRWWITGSAWSGHGPTEHHNPAEHEGNEMNFSSVLLKAAKKQRMNTNLRKQIFCVMLSSEDYCDAFERLLKLNLKEKQAREIVHVLIHCCLQEKLYNPFYAHLANRLCEFSKCNQVTFQYSLWDRFKTITTMKKYSLRNMAQFLAHMIASKSLSLSVLKVVSFGGLDKISVEFFTHFFKTLLSEYPESSVKLAFQRISSLPKLSLLREGIKLFLIHFLDPSYNHEKNKLNIEKSKWKELIQKVESALDGCEYVPL